MDESDQVKVYEIVVNKETGERAKAIDVLALRRWFAIREAEKSVLSIDLDNLPTDNIHFVMAKALQQERAEIINFLNEVLGISKPKEVVEEKSAGKKRSVEDEEIDEKLSEDDELNIDMDDEPLPEKKVGKKVVEPDEEEIIL